MNEFPLTLRTFIIRSNYRKTSNLSRTLVGNKIVDNLSEDNCMGMQETFKFWNLVRLILDVSWYM